MSTQHEGEALAARVDSLAAWVSDVEAQLRATAVTGDAKALKELAKALEAWSKHDPKLEERITNRVDVLADRFATLSGTVNTTAAALAGKDGEIAQLRRELEAGNARIEALVHDLRRSGSSAEVADLRKAIASLSTDRGAGPADSRVDSIASDVDVLAQRLDTLSKTVSTTASSLAGKEGELVSLRARLEEGDARADALVAELRSSVSQLSTQISSADGQARDPHASRIFENHLLDLGSRVEQLTAGLDAVSAAVGATTTGLETNAAELADVQRRLDEASARVESLVAELHEVEGALTTSGPVDRELEAGLEARLAALARQTDELATSLSRLDSEASQRSEQAAAATLELERLVDATAHRLGEIERAHAEASAELARIGGAWTEERTWVRDQLDDLAAAVADARREAAETAGGYETVSPRLQELAARIEATEHGQHGVSDEVARISAAVDDARRESGEHAGKYESVSERLQELAARVDANERGQRAVSEELARIVGGWDAERATLRQELEAVATSIAITSDAPAGSPDGFGERSEQLLADLAAKLETLEREGVAVAAEISRVESTWAGELGSLATRVEEVAGAAGSAPAGPDPQMEARFEQLLRRLEALELELASPAREAIADSDEVHDIRVLVNGLRMRLATNEKELAALSGSGDVVPRLDDLSVRLSLLERTAAAAPQHASMPGDGRFRVELRGLELRMQELELAARENRDAVLTQFEKLASRLQWRLQQLETTDVEYGPSTPSGGRSAGLGQVVPIRGDV